MATISLRITDEELDILNAYAKINGKSLSEVVRNVMMEHIEDQFDMQVFAEYEKEKSEGKLKTRPVNKLWEELQL